jgi:hypothetical protein
LTNYRRGLCDIEEAWSRRRSVLAQFIRAEVLSSQADDTGNMEDADAAREALRGTRAFMKDAPMASVSSLYFYATGCNNARLHGRPNEAKRWLAEGEDDYRIAGTGACRVHPASLEIRSSFLQLRDGTAQSLDAENREAGKRGVHTATCQAYLASLLRRGKEDEALEYLRCFPDGGSNILTYLRVVFLVRQDLEGAREECRRAVRDAGRSRDHEYLVFALSLAGMEDEARRQAEALARTPPPAPEWDDQRAFLGRLFAHAYGGEPMDVESSADGSRWRMHMAYGVRGFAALARGDREGARKWFQADEYPPLFTGDYLWRLALRDRILAADPVWPPWLAGSK